ncbi:hypothetical protein N9025_02255 [Synechococcus sp. AH-707-B22]|nr:hypothetical protein [Synechococcus sp. AH-707-B22]
MKMFAALAVAAFATASYAVEAKPLVFRCENPDVQFSVSTLVINEGTGQITQTWDADGFTETNKGTFKMGSGVGRLSLMRLLETQVSLMT